MKKYLNIYKTLLLLNLQVLTAYRANFVNSAISTVVWGSMSFLSIFLLTARTNQVAGWSRNDLLLLTAIYNIVIGSFHVLFSRNFERFSRIMHMAEFDTLLTKPIDSQFSISFWYFNYTSIFRVIVGVIVAAVILKSRFFLELPVFLLLSLVGITLSYCIWFLISTLMVKYTNLSNIVEVLYQINGFSRYPMDLYRGLGLFAFTFIVPLVIMITVPAKYLASKVTSFDLLMLFGITLLFFITTRLAWKFALRFYASASG